MYTVQPLYPYLSASYLANQPGKEEGKKKAKNTHSKTALASKQ
jgi:hypothetical protein